MSPDMSSPVRTDASHSVGISASAIARHDPASGGRNRGQLVLAGERREKRRFEKDAELVSLQDLASHAEREDQLRADPGAGKNRWLDAGVRPSRRRRRALLGGIRSAKLGKATTMPSPLKDVSSPVGKANSRRVARLKGCDPSADAGSSAKVAPARISRSAARESSVDVCCVSVGDPRAGAVERGRERGGRLDSLGETVGKEKRRVPQALDGGHFGAARACRR